MTKEEYLGRLRVELLAIGITNVDSRIDFYAEMIDDRIEDGMDENEAVASMEPIETIIENTRLEKPVSALVLEKVQQSRKKAEKNGHSLLWIALIILGFPLWFPLMLTFGILLLTLFILYWVIVFSLFIVELSLGATAIAAFAAPFLWINDIASIGTKIGSLGAAFILAGVVILLWKPLILLGKVAGKLFTMLVRGIKRLIF